jgi:hypothetical protein
MRLVVALAVASSALVVGLACVGATTPSGIRGTVIRGPTSPVCREGVPCTAPAAGVALVFVRKGVVVRRVTTAGNGSFRVALAPGTYVVRTARTFPIGGMSARSVKVRQARFTVVKLSIDTGIR